jgi:hypothetical protein
MLSRVISAAAELTALVTLIALTVVIAASDGIPHDALATRIVSALKPEAGERVLLRYDPNTLGALEPVLRAKLEAAGAKVESLRYGAAPDLAARLASTDIYIWLPAASDADTPADQRALLAKWLDEGRGRQIHFHWNGGTRDIDGLEGAHSTAYDRVYADALNIDYAALKQQQDVAIAALRGGDVHVTTPAGTNLTFKVGDRPFNRQDGDASKARMASAKTRVDREIELPAGVIRVAPLEETVHGVLVIPSARFSASSAAVTAGSSARGETEVTGIRLEFEKGKIVRASAKSGEAALKAFLASAPGASQFREFGLGFNPKLVVPKGQTFLPYYGYGAGVVRLSLGDNFEIGGAVRGGGVRWMFFPDTTVRVNNTVIVANGKLVSSANSSR